MVSEKTFEPAAERKQVEVVLELFESLPQARAETGHAYQALTNYVSNAIKFLPSGGVVKVRTNATDFTVRLAVHDDGPGVPGGLATVAGLSLAGCDRLTISPALLEELAADAAPLTRALSPEGQAAIAQGIAQAVETFLRRGK